MTRRAVTQSEPSELRRCPKPDGCGLELHYSRFPSRKRKMPNGYVWHFDRLCRACQQASRNQQKNANRALAIIEGRAAARAKHCGTTKAFLLHDMHWLYMEPTLRTLMGSDGRCLPCGHPFDHERDIQIDHIEPPRFPQDWAREHASNLRFICQNCNRLKGKKSFAAVLDEQEEIRRSNLVLDGQSPVVPTLTHDLDKDVLPWGDDDKQIFHESAAREQAKSMKRQQLMLPMMEVKAGSYE